MSIKRLFVEKKREYGVAAKKLKSDLKNVLAIKAADVRIFLRYDIEGLSGKDFDAAVTSVFSEPPVDNVYFENLPSMENYTVIASEYLPGQYDQRADSAAQCVQMLTLGTRPIIKCATVYAFDGVDANQSEKLANYLINPVEARKASLAKPLTLVSDYAPPEPVESVAGFTDFTDEQIGEYHSQMGFAMSKADLKFVQDFFKEEKRNPTVTELKVIDTYWSDHCRHTTFLTELKDIKINSDIPQICEAYENYVKLFNKHHKGKSNKYFNLMDMATMGARELKSAGHLKNLDESEEINACSIKVTADVNGKNEDWLVMFKNETHNHPTEIEPFGGAATCLGGAIRDPLSGRVYVYQAMRVTGAADITAPFSATIKGKLPQRVISRTAAAGFSSYGNQIGLATGGVHEVYHDGYVAKRLETGFVVGAAPLENVVREQPCEGDVVVLIGGETGRDGCGGATGSSKVHTIESIDKCGAEVQKGNPLTERKIQRLFRNREVTKLIKRCNDFGAGGISVAIGELSSGLDINLDVVPKKYQGLSATELAISESQERMAVVVRAEDAKKMIELCAEENLTGTIVAQVTSNERMRMFFNGNVVVDIKRSFLDTNGVRQTAEAVINEAAAKFFNSLTPNIEQSLADGDYATALKLTLSDKNVCSQKGLGEIFDSTIGAGTVIMPFGGKTQMTPSIAMAAKLPVSGITDTATIAAYGFNANLMSQAPFTGAVYSVALSVSKAVCAGAPYSSIYLTLQEFFERMFADPTRWGKPAAALLGALYAQIKLKIAAIGGKDSMSGTFEKIDVPPTLLSFALGVGKASNIISNVASAGEKVYRIKLKRDSNNQLDFDNFIAVLNAVEKSIANKAITFATVIENGGAVAAAVKSCLGNMVGIEFIDVDRSCFVPALCDIVLAATDISAFEKFDISLIGSTNLSGKITFAPHDKSSSIKVDTLSESKSLALEDTLKAFTGTFENVYPTIAESVGETHNINYTSGNKISSAKSILKPQVFIPVFPGTNCEYDTFKRFEIAGAKPIIYVIKNRNENELRHSLDDVASIINNSQIIAFPGGFSGGDEPDGSGKFIATAFRNGKIADAIMNMLYKRDGLAIGICNGFQALIKLGLLPTGKVCDLAESSPTLTFNNISRHVSTVSYIRVASNLSPWMNALKVGDIYSVAISHGEGKLIASDKDLKLMEQAGQVATQYVDLCGNASLQSPFNPNGSMLSIEGITSADGRILGKMGHSERIGDNIMKNIGMPSDMKIFESGVKYFK